MGGPPSCARSSQFLQAPPCSRWQQSCFEEHFHTLLPPGQARPAIAPSNPFPSAATARSEEHTSELQSPCNLVCRLLLEKKKKRVQTDPYRIMHKVPRSLNPHEVMKILL